MAGRATWVGILTSSQANEDAQGTGLLLETARQLLSSGPSGSAYRHEWSVRNKGISGATLAQAILAEWPTADQRPVHVTEGQPRTMFHNPNWLPEQREALVEHLVVASQGRAPTEEGWFFTGRTRVLRQIIDWLEEEQPGLFLLTGGAGCGKSAVVGRIAALSDPDQRDAAIKHGALSADDPDPGERSVDASVHLRGMTTLRLSVELAQQLGLPEPETAAALLNALQQRGNADDPPTAILLDGLDEAAPNEAHSIAEDLLIPLSKIARVLLATRDRPFQLQRQPQEPLAVALTRTIGSRVIPVELDKEPNTLEDLQDYLTARLRAVELTADQVSEIAPYLARRAIDSDGGFLFARIVSTHLAKELLARPDTLWREEILAPSQQPSQPTSMAERGAPRLALPEGNGFPLSGRQWRQP
ncbi:hypothetical protein [Streptacidiphilus sp. PAMC 29251]